MKLKSVEEAYNALIDIRDNNANPALIDDAIGYLGQAFDEDEYKYCIVIRYSMDKYPETVLFTGYEEATDYLLKAWEDCYNAFLVDDVEFVEYMTYHEEKYARVVWDGEYTEFVLTEISEPCKFE